MESLILFNNITNKDILDSVLELKTNSINKCEAVSKLVTFGLKNKFTGNLWHCYLAYVLAYNENPFSIAAENKGKITGDVSLVMHDMQIYYDYFNLDLNRLFGEYANQIIDFSMNRKNYDFYNKDILKIITELSNNLVNSKNVDEFYHSLLSFYQKYGVSDMGFHKAFRISNSGDLIPIKDVLKVEFSDLVGYEYQKEQLIYNTKCFVSDKYANNVLLYGDAGTGKSTSIKAILNMFYKDGLRIIEVYKNQMSDVANLIAKLKKRNYYFVIYMDDLSFEESEIEYKHLKSIIEGGLEAKPRNVLVYASSNRRHLIKETTADNATIMDDLHRNETAAEKLSLASRFGLQILYMSPSNQEFKTIVKELAKKHKIKISEDELLKQATIWEMQHGGLSGRTAEQFIMYISGGKIEL